MKTLPKTLNMLADPVGVEGGVLCIRSHWPCRINGSLTSMNKDWNICIIAVGRKKRKCKLCLSLPKTFREQMGYFVSKSRRSHDVREDRKTDNKNKILCNWRHSILLHQNSQDDLKIWGHSIIIYRDISQYITRFRAKLTPMKHLISFDFKLPMFWCA